LPDLFLWVSFFLLLSLANRSEAAAADLQSGPVSSVGPGPQFAIADFDGDLHPDLASVQAGSNSSGSTNYWIQLQLSAVGRESIRLLAPAGGLRIEARDVNGDHAVDLVLATTWFNRPVAVFLNDGHGRFSRAEPAAFPEAFNESNTKLAPFSYECTEAAGIPPQSTVGFWPEARGLPHARSQTSSIPPSNAGFRLSSFLVSHAGRAPPSEVAHS
jgi:hypothetical protein